MHAVLLTTHSHRVLECVRADETSRGKRTDAKCLLFPGPIITDEASDPGRVGTWIMALVLGALAVLAAASLCHRVDLNKKRRFLARADETALKSSNVDSIPIAPVMMSVNKVPGRAS